MCLSRAMLALLAVLFVPVIGRQVQAEPYRPIDFETTGVEMQAGSMAKLATEPGAASGAKYTNLLRKIEVPGDRETYGEYYDWGYWSGTEWSGHTDLPAGYWVYVDGTWYIFGASSEQPAAAHVKRAWGPEQATGAPDTPQEGDYATAWASRTADGQAEWLALTYDQPIDATAVLVYETLNPGAINKVSVFDQQGSEHVAFERPLNDGPVPYRELTRPEHRPNVAVFPLNIAFPTQQVKVYLDSAAVPGFNEIDAVGLLDAQGQTHWASGATASSTYAEPATGLDVEQTIQSADPAGDRIQRLEAQVNALGLELQRLKTLLEQGRLPAQNLPHLILPEGNLVPSTVYWGTEPLPSQEPK